MPQGEVGGQPAAEGMPDDVHGRGPERGEGLADPTGVRLGGLQRHRLVAEARVSQRVDGVDGAFAGQDRQEIAPHRDARTPAGQQQNGSFG